MPCDTIATTSLKWGDNTNHDRMFGGLKDLNLSPLRSGKFIRFSGGSYDTENNVLTLNGGDVEKRTSLIKQAYSGSVVKAQARKYGWGLKETAPFKYQVTKRSI